jgi:hypothetical protein
MSRRLSGAIDFTNPLILQAWRTAWRLLQGCTQSEGLGVMISRRSPCSPLTAAFVIQARTALPRLIQSARQFDLASSFAIALPLLGAGPGLTPSWDDLLIGFLCGLRDTSGIDPSRCQFINQFGRAMARASTKTTAVSRAYIQRTIDGAGPVWIEDALAAIAAGDTIDAHAATARALRVGHTSGVDMMLGVILGSAVWQHGSEVNQVLSALSCRRCEFHPISDDNHKRPSSPQLPEPR